MREIVVVLDNIRSALNTGAILRTADGAAIKNVYLCGVTPEITHFKIGKTALGAEFKVPTKHVDSTIQAIQELKEAGYTVVAVEQTPRATMLNQTKLPAKVAFIFGHEAGGVSHEVLENSDLHIQLPMLGSKNSLNVATTVGIVLYYVRLNEVHI